MTFDMGQDTLNVLSVRTSGAHSDLGAEVQRFVDAASEALEGKFNGTARAAFDRFKLETDEVARELNLALASVLAGIDGQNLAFTEGETQMGEETNTVYTSADWQGARGFRRAV